VLLNIIIIEEIMYGRVGVIKMSSNNTNGSRYTEDWLPVRSIANGMIETNNKYRITGVKIKPKNIFILDMQTQNNIIASLKTFYDTLDFEFWLISNDRPVDISSYLATLQIQYNNIQDPRIKKILVQDIEKANTFMRENVTDIEYFILFKDRNPDMIQKRIRTLILGLSNCGLEATQVSNEDLRVILDGFLNGGVPVKSKAVLPNEF